ncbi:MAG: hypothetical protein JW814_12635 [Candidatus Krumholzibacteriota bacterium]|nr:hypothetical protein [Candidatus Krumholzibacteriota bacterium]
MLKTSLPVLISLYLLLQIPTAVPAAEVNCYNGSSLSGIEGLDIEVTCNPLAEKILFHRSLVRDYAVKHLLRAGIDISGVLEARSGMIAISVATVEMKAESGVEGFATTLNIDLNRAALCLLDDEEFHAISSIVWEEDRLIVSSEDEVKEFIIEILSRALDNLANDLRTADPGKYAVSSLDTESE